MIRLHRLLPVVIGKQFKCNSTVDEATIEDLLNRNSIEAKEVIPVQKSIYRKHGKRGPMTKRT